MADSLFTAYIKDTTSKAIFNSIDLLTIEFKKADPKIIQYKIQAKLAAHHLLNDCNHIFHQRHVHAYLQIVIPDLRWKDYLH